MKKEIKFGKGDKYYRQAKKIINITNNVFQEIFLKKKRLETTF